MTITRSGMTPEAIEELVNQRVEEALAAYKATRAANALEAESQSQNGSEVDKRTIGAEAAFAMSWRELMKLMAKRFQELTMMCTKMVPEEEDRVEKFIGGLPDNIQRNGYAVKNAENKRRLEVNQRDNHRQQPPFKRPNVKGQNVARAYMAGNNKKKLYNRLLPLCNKCKLHHEGPCTVRCGKCNKVGHLTQDCKVTNPTTSSQRGQIVNQRVFYLFRVWKARTLQE
ncbi:reverse transcriptase domain-containing protein [Tanacetum coccineum]